MWNPLLAPIPPALQEHSRPSVDGPIRAQALRDDVHHGRHLRGDMSALERLHPIYRIIDYHWSVYTEATSSNSGNVVPTTV